MTTRPVAPPARLDWLDPLKALGLIAILFNHLVEEFGPGPWFTNPTNNWPDLATRLHTWPTGSLPVLLVRWLGWLGDSGPGVFILASGVGLTYAALRRPRSELSLPAFFRRRVLRLFPLYIAMHIVILGASLGVPGVELNLAGGKTLLSLLGLRVTRELFFYISPSWWFVWLILQLYLVFPLLLRLLERVGVRWFLAITVAFTIASRGLGVLYSGNLYQWMMGMFFGTRLAEFATGMAVAALLARSATSPGPRFGPGRALLAGAVVYLLGLAASFTLLGSLVASLLVTLGLSALFYAAWEGLLRRSPAAARATVYVGAASYAVFLFHQAPLHWTGVVLGARQSLHLIAALGVLVVSFPVSVTIERMVAWLQRAPRTLVPAGWRRLGSGVVALGMALALLLIERLFSVGGRFDRAFEYMVGLSVAALLYVEWSDPQGERAVERALRRGLIIAGLLQLFVLPPRFGDVALGLSLALAASWVLAAIWVPRPAPALAAGLALSALVLGGSELALRQLAPLETNVWGELPALAVHPTRGYGLKPNAVTRLRYNNYDYVVRTNAEGLPGPEIASARPTPDALRILVIGDAFTMPEGLSYDQAYPALLQAALARCLAPRAVEVINAGVTGYGPPQELPQLRELLPRYRPDVVAYEFFINEFSDVRASNEERRVGSGLVPRASPRLVETLEGMQLLAHVRRLEDDAAERVTGRPAAWKTGRSLLQLYRAGPNVLYADSNVARLRGYLDAMRSAARDAGARFVIYFVPGAVAVLPAAEITYFPRGVDLTDTTQYDLDRPWRVLSGIAAQDSLVVEDLTPSLRVASTVPPYFPASWHWTAQGHRLVAKAIAQSLARREVVPGRCGQW
jgi:peptidoglycan/LPS O-acetylase OafA/YrhL